MTVKQLIETLSEMDPDLEVYVNGYEGGYNDAVLLEPIMVCKNYHTEWYYGKHEDITQTTKSAADLSAYQITKGIVIQ